jgi:hypothetical protein
MPGMAALFLQIVAIDWGSGVFFMCEIMGQTARLYLLWKIRSGMFLFLRVCRFGFRLPALPYLPSIFCYRFEHLSQGEAVRLC